MVEQNYIEHHIQKHILAYLMGHEYARFRDMRPANTDTNLYSYHLKLLQKKNLVTKTDAGYTLTTSGMSYVDRTNSDTLKLSLQPKIITMLVIQNGYGGVLMYRKLRQPFINTWTLPHGKVHNADKSIDDAAQRELREKVGPHDIKLEHVGDCYVRVKDSGEVKISTAMHIFYGTSDAELEGEHLQWMAPHKIPGLTVAPAIDQIIARTFFRDPYFFEEYDVDW